MTRLKSSRKQSSYNRIWPADQIRPASRDHDLQESPSGQGSPGRQRIGSMAVAVEVRLEELVSGRDAQQRMAPDPDFPHEIDGDLAD